MALTKITTSVIAANTLGTANIADNSIDATKIAANSILTRHIDDDQITGDQLADDITIAGNLTVTGNLVTNGASVTNSSTNTTIEDNLIELGTGTTGSPSSDSGIVIERGDSDNAFIGWDESEDKFILGTGSFTGASTGNLTITTAPLVVGALTTSGLSFPTSDGTNGQVLKTDGSGSLTFGDNTTKVDNFTATGDGSTTAFDTGINPGSEVNTWIFIDGVYQQKSEYSYSGSTVTFTTAPQNGASIDVITGTSSNITASDTVLGVYEATTTNTDTYATGISASNENNTWVFVGGVYQPKDSYTFSSGTLTFDANTPTGQKLSVVATKTITAGAVDTSTLAANAVTSAKIASNSILSRHIANNSIVGADISATTQITASTFTGALTGDVTGNVVGNLTGTVQTAAQTNITSVGTLSALTVSGQLTAGGLSYPTSDGTNEQVLRTDGSGNLSFGTISGTTINNNTNNYVMTGTGTANTLNGESGLTYDGTKLSVDATSDGSAITAGLVSGQNVEIGLDRWTGSGSNFHQWQLYTDVDDLQIKNVSNNIKGTAFTSRVNFAANGDISFYEDTGTTEKLFWDASAESLGIGTTSVSAPLDVVTNSNVYAAEFTQSNTSNGDGVLILVGSTASADYALTVRSDGGNTSALAVKADGNVGIGTFTPNSYSNLTALTLNGTNGSVADFEVNGTLSGEIFAESNSLKIDALGSSGVLKLLTNSSERLTIDSLGNVGIGTTNPNNYSGYTTLTLNNDTNGAIIDFELNGTLVGEIYTQDSNTFSHQAVGARDINFRTNGSERMRIDSSGNVGIGNTNPAAFNSLGGKQVVIGDGTQTNNLTLYSSTTGGGIGYGHIAFADSNTSSSTAQYAGLIQYYHGDDSMALYTGSTKRMTIDSSGNLLVSASGGELRIMNSTTIAGNIGRTSSSELFLANGNTGLRFIGALSSIVPCDGSGANRDNAIDWGYSSVRFDDIYATNGTIQTSDRNEKQDIEALTDAETRVAVTAKGLLRKFRWQSAVEEKGDEARIHFGIIAQDLQDAFTAEGLDASDYAMFISSTWTDDDGVEQTRLGVRYSELLAFIIAAI
jgi:hypothetical protein